jgi:hypothetical protein
MGPRGMFLHNSFLPLESVQICHRICADEVLQWPGYNNSPRGLVVAGLSRTALAKEVATCVAIFLRDAAHHSENSAWSPRGVHFGDVRLVAMNYYSRVWVPVLALDTDP